MFLYKIIDISRWLDAIDFEDIRPSEPPETLDEIYYNLGLPVSIAQHEYG
jgi:hypothetical protein